MGSRAFPDWDQPRDKLGSWRRGGYEDDYWAAPADIVSAETFEAIAEAYREQYREQCDNLEAVLVDRDGEEWRKKVEEKARAYIDLLGREIPIETEEEVASANARVMHAISQAMYAALEDEEDMAERIRGWLDGISEE